MNKRIVLSIFVTMFLSSAILDAQFVTSIAVDPAIIKVPDDYPTIQEAVNVASPGTLYE